MTSQLKHSHPKCPKCGGEMECDEVDNGVGMQQVGPYGCPACHYVEDSLQFLDDDTYAYPALGEDTPGVLEFNSGGGGARRVNRRLPGK